MHLLCIEKSTGLAWGGCDDKEDDAECSEHDDDDEDGDKGPYMDNASAVTCKLKSSNSESSGEFGQVGSPERTVVGRICIAILQLGTFNRRSLSREACMMPYSNHNEASDVESMSPTIKAPPTLTMSVAVDDYVTSSASAGGNTCANKLSNSCFHY